MTATVEGTEVKVGDCVGFKCDIEQYGIITKIGRTWAGKPELTVKPAGSSFEGEYISGSPYYSVPANECWID